jgi:hypothetical protein
MESAVMRYQSTMRKTALVAAMTLALTGIATLDNDLYLQTGFSSVISSVYAGEGSGEKGMGHKGAMGGAQGGQSENDRGGQSHKGGKSILEVLAEDEGDPGGEGNRGFAGGNSGNPSDTGSGKPTDAHGEDFGDIVIVERDDLGNPTGLVMIYTVNEDGETVVSRTAEYTADGELPALEEGEFFIPVEFGRMNVARSPESVIEHSLIEALSKLDSAETVSLDPSGRLVFTTAEDETFTIDSPLENLALYEALLTAPEADDGSITLSVTTTVEGGGTVTYDWTIPSDWDRLDLAASALAASSDKTGDLTIDEIVNISSFLNVDDELALLVGDYSYNPEDAYPDELKIWILVPDANDPTILYKEEVSINDYVSFTEVDDSSIQQDEGDTDGIDEFADAANDAVQVLEFVHDNEVEAPVTE